MESKTKGNSHSFSGGVLIEAFPQYLPDYSNPSEHSFYFTYRIKITNKEHELVKLVSRHWVIINGNGEQEEVKGHGVVGKNPVLKKDEFFEYSSYCPLDTEWGTMEGTYVFEDGDGNIFESKIGRFYLTNVSENRAAPYS